MFVPSWKGCATAAPELASVPHHHFPLRAMQMKAAAFWFLCSAQLPAFCTSRRAWLVVRKQLGVVLFVLFRRLCPFRQCPSALMLFAEIPGSPGHLFNCMKDLAQWHRRELLPSTSQAGNGCEEGDLVFQMLLPSAMEAEGIPKGNYLAFMLLLLMEDGEWAAGCGGGVLPLHAAPSHNS